MGSVVAEVEAGAFWVVVELQEGAVELLLCM